MPSVEAKSILVVCSERSGSNLIKAILSQHPQVFVGPPIPLFECFRPIIDSYGDLSSNTCWNELIDDVIDLVAVNHQPLPCVVTREAVLEAAALDTRGWAAVVRAVYGIIARSQGAEILGYKYSTNMHDLAPFMSEMRFSHVVYQVRDPRDVVLSTMNTGFVDESPDDIARRWQSAQEHARRALVASGNAMHFQRYEDLLAKPRRTLDKLWAYLELPPCEEALAFHAARISREMANRSHAWANVARPLMRKNYRKFYKEWNINDVRGIEAIVETEMKWCGYKPANRFLFHSRVRRPVKRDLSESDYEFFRPQADKWEEINRKARARLDRTAC